MVDSLIELSGTNCRWLLTLGQLVVTQPRGADNPVCSVTRVSQGVHWDQFRPADLSSAH